MKATARAADEGIAPIKAAASDVDNRSIARAASSVCASMNA
jgi:hypothetical protein